jgi:Uma2 family endonuclease
MTAQEMLQDMPLELDTRDYYFEIIEGVEIPMPSPRPLHQRISMRLSYLLHGLVESHHLGEVQAAPSEIRFDEDNLLQPDLFFIARQGSKCHWNPLDDQWQGAPDLCIEILSPSTTKNDRGVKFRLYERFGVGEYWIVDPAARAVEVYQLEGDRYTLTGVYQGEDKIISAALPLLEVTAQSLFPTDLA